MDAAFIDDIRQAYVISENEIKKYLRGKKLLIFGILILAVTVLLTVLPYAFGGQYNASTDVEYTFTTNISIILELAVVLFTATALVSEFEDRTALVLFTKPVKKWVIFVGKLMASFIVMTVFTLIYYAYIAIFALIATGGADIGLLTSLAMSILSIIGMSGIAMFMSAIAKKGSTASILTLVFFILLIGLISTMLNTFAHIDTWWSIDDASSYLSYVFEGIRPVIHDTNFIEYVSVTTGDVIRAGAVMIVWGIVTNFVAFFLFNKRDF